MIAEGGSTRKKKADLPKKMHKKSNFITLEEVAITLI
jgi:hypothetical protein